MNKTSSTALQNHRLLNVLRDTEARLEEARKLLARVEPELAPNYDLAQELSDTFGLGRPGASSLIKDIRKALEL